MKKKVQKTGKTALHRRKLVRKVITFAVCCIAITGGLFTFFYADLMFNSLNIPVKNLMDAHIPGLFNILLLVSVSIILSLSIAGFLFKKTFRGNNLSRIPDAYEEIKVMQDITEEVKEEKTPIPETVMTNIPPPAASEIQMLKADLESEKSWNNLILSLLSINENSTEYEINAINAISAFCRSDYIGYYQRNTQSQLFDRKYYHDANSTFARHSKQIEALDAHQYPWLMQQLNTGKAFTLYKGDMDKLIDELQDEANEAKKWLQLQAIETSEYKLCKHEDWNYLIALAFIDSGNLKGVFILGFQNNILPPDALMIDRLRVIFNALGRRISCPKPVLADKVSSENIEAILYNLSEACFTTDQDGIIQIVNPAAVKLSGLSESEVAGKYWSHIYHLIDCKNKQPITDPLRKLSHEKTCYDFSEVALLTRSNQEINLEGMVAPYSFTNGVTSGYIFTLRDITDKLERESEELKLQKTEAISSLSAGLAHDFNNLLTAILGNISLVLDDIPANSDQAQLLKAAEECTLKGKDITDRLLTFAKGSPQQDVSSEVEQILQSTVRNLLKDTNIRVTYNIISELPSISMSSANFETIITNLVNNSIQAMSNGGDITISAEYKIIEDTNAILKPGAYVCIHIIDSGEGIPHNNMSRIFTPYFTTRMGNSGLGLPTVNSILVKHNGIIRIQSQTGNGADCELYIPAKSASANKSIDLQPVSDKANILVLDEDDMLGNLLIKTLTRMDFNVIKTSKAEDLMTVISDAKGSQNPIKLAILNLDISTESDIIRLAYKIKLEYPNMHLIAYSSHIHIDDRNEFEAKGFDDILLKPFNISNLKELVAKRLLV